MNITSPILTGAANATELPGDTVTSFFRAFGAGSSDGGLCRIEAEISQRCVPHVRDHEGEQHQHGGGGEPVLHQIAPAAVAAAEIDRQRDRDRQRRGDAGQGRHDHAKAVRAAGSECPEEGGHGIARQLGRIGGAGQDRGGDVHRLLAGLLQGQFEPRTIGILASWSPKLELWFKRPGRRFKRARTGGFVR